MEHNRLLEIAAERAMCDLCVDSGGDACIACHKVKGVTAAELRECHSAVYAALCRIAEDDKAREEGRLVESGYDMAALSEGGGEDSIPPVSIPEPDGMRWPF